MWAQERNVDLPINVAEMIADKARANIREMEGVFNQLAATTHLSRRPVTIDMAESALVGYRRPRHHQLTMARVLTATAEYFQFAVSDLVGPRRTARLNNARQIAMYLAREVTMASLPQIGDAFGGRTHSTVLHSCNKVSHDLTTDDLLRADINAIQAMLLGQD